MALKNGEGEAQSVESTAHRTGAPLTTHLLETAPTPLAPLLLVCSSSKLFLLFLLASLIEL